MGKLKIAICQFGLKDTHSYDEMAGHLGDMCQKALAHGPDLVLFPEFTTFGLLAMAGEKLAYADLKQVVPEVLGGFEDAYRQVLGEAAAAGGAVIVGGSTWIKDPAGGGYNTAHAFYPDGTVIRQKKNHLFPGETDWGTKTHDQLKLLDIAGAQVGIMTCYDAEFPEVARHFMLQGAEVLLCPSATYTERGYFRVRRCSAARAVENQLYVVECHQVGALSVPVDLPFTGYGYSAILCPIDEHTGVNNGVMYEAAAPDQELVLFGEVDLEVLQRSREKSEATILKDRRPQTYDACYTTS